MKNRQYINPLTILLAVITALMLNACGSDSDDSMEAYSDMLAAEATATVMAYVPTYAAIYDYSSQDPSDRAVRTDAYYEGNRIIAKASVYAYAQQDSTSGLIYETAAVFNMTGQLQYVSYSDYSDPYNTTTIRSTYAFDDQGHIIEAVVDDAAGNPEYRYVFTYDGNGDKFTEKHYTYSGGWQLSQNITYDNDYNSNGQLIQVTVNGGDSHGDVYTYSYNASGNIIQERLVQNDGTVHISNFTYNSAGKPATVKLYEKSVSAANRLYEINITWSQREVPLKVRDYIDNLDVRQLAGLEAGFQLPAIN